MGLFATTYTRLLSESNTEPNATYPPIFTMLPMILFGKKYCRSSQRVQQEIQEQSWNIEEQELRAMPN